MDSSILSSGINFIILINLLLIRRIIFYTHINQKINKNMGEFKENNSQFQDKETVKITECMATSRRLSGLGLSSFESIKEKIVIEHEGIDIINNHLRDQEDFGDKIKARIGGQEFPIVKIWPDSGSKTMVITIWDKNQVGKSNLSREDEGEIDLWTDIPAPAQE